MSDDAPVDTKCTAVETFGNDGTADTNGTVDIKYHHVETFGNDTIGFIRVRKRKLKGGHDDYWRDCRVRNGTAAVSAMSFDLVRAVRVGGKPRHQFVLGLGSQKNRERGSFFAVAFWTRALYRLTDHGLNVEQRRRLIAEMVRKGARLPSLENCDAFLKGSPHMGAPLRERIDELKSIIG